MAIPPPLPVDRMPVAAHASLGGRRTLERTAAEFAAMGADQAEGELARLTEGSIQGRRMEEAIFWQRVRFRSRLIRAQKGAAPR